MRCKICSYDNKSIFNATVLKKHDIEYFYCQNCGFLQTEEPYWLDEAYSDSINVSDTGYMQRNINFSKTLTVLLTNLFDRDVKYLDYAGGYGVFVRLMRDIGFDFYWDDKYTTNLFVRGFEYTNQKVSAITTFESFEHYVNPIEEIEKLLSISKTIIFSTELLQKNIPKPENWWYYGLDHGQHISFYSEKTLYYIARKYELNYYNLGTLQVLTDKVIPSYIKLLMKFNRFGVSKLIKRKLKSKTWSDHLQMSGNNENTI